MLCPATPFSPCDMPQSLRRSRERNIYTHLTRLEPQTPSMDPLTIPLYGELQFQSLKIASDICESSSPFHFQAFPPLYALCVVNLISINSRWFLSFAFAKGGEGVGWESYGSTKLLRTPPLSPLVLMIPCYSAYGEGNFRETAAVKWARALAVVAREFWIRPNWTKKLSRKPKNVGSQSTDICCDKFHTSSYLEAVCWQKCYTIRTQMGISEACAHWTILG